MSVALPALGETLGWTSDRIGLIGGVFFWTYAIGQFINGSLGDRFSSRLFVFFGLIGTACMNMLFAQAFPFAVMAIIWGVNGYFQSTGWGPIVKTASRWMDKSHRSTTATILGTSFVFGSSASLFLSGYLIEKYNQWELLFRAPSVILFAMAVIWVAFLRNDPTSAGLGSPQGTGAVSTYVDGNRQQILTQLKETLRFLRQPYFVILTITAMMLGMIKEGLTLWTPSLISQSQGLDIGHAVQFSYLVPIMGILGVLLGGWLHHKVGDEAKTIMILYYTLAIACINARFTMLFGSPVLFSLSLGLCSMLVHGINIVIMSIIPMSLSRSGKSSSIAGSLDSCSYLGAGMMAFATGIMLRTLSWSAILMLWATISIVGGSITLFNLRKPN